MPLIDQEYHARYRDAKLGNLFFRLSPRPIFLVSGSDSLRFLNGQITNDLRMADDNRSIYTAITTAKGKMEAVAWITRIGDDYLIDTEPRLADSLLARIEKYIIADDVELKDVSSQWTLFHRLGSGDSPIQEPPVLARKTIRLGETGTDLWYPAHATPPLPEAPSTIGEIIRIENRFAKWGHDIDTATLPPEARMEETAISYTKGCYIGQETISRIKSIGRVNRTLCKLQLIGNVPPNLPDLPQPLLHGTQQAGFLTSAAFSPESQNCVALGMVSRQYAQSHTQLTTPQSTWIVVD